MSIAKFTPDTFGGLPRHRGPSGAPSRPSMGPVPPATHPRVGYMLVLGGAALFALNAGFSKVVLDAGIEPARLTTLRCTGAAVGLLLFLVATDRRRLRLDPRDIPGLIVLGLAGAALIQWLYFVALDRIPVGIALLIEFTGPLMVAVFSRVVLHHAMHRRIWLALGLALGGLALVAQIWRDVGLDAIGLAAAFGAAGCLATFHLLGKHTLRKRDPITLSFWMFAFASVFWAILQPWWTFDAGVLLHHVSLLGSLSDISVPVWLPMLWVIVLGTLAPYSLEVRALTHLAPTTAGLVGMVEPVLAAVVAWIWLEQGLGVIQVLGGVVVLTAVVIVQLSASDPGAAVPHAVADAPVG
jgi:drug/metabolite transporter (DMT)-like permease